MKKGRPLLQLLACLLTLTQLPPVPAVDICRVPPPASSAAAGSTPTSRLVATRTKCSDVSATARRTRLAGVNIYDALWDANGPTANFSETMSTLQEAKSSGVELFRFFGFLWGPAHSFWYTNPDIFW